MKKNKTPKSGKLDAGSRHETLHVICESLTEAMAEILEEAFAHFGVSIESLELAVAYGSKPSVPTTDKIEIPKNVVDQCKKQCVCGLSLNEKKQILTLRKAGKSIKEIARAIHRRDRAVSKFLKESK